MYRLWAGQAQYMYMTILPLFGPCDLDCQPTQNVLNGTSSPQKQQLW